jgi:hypothetical protein
MRFKGNLIKVPITEVPCKICSKYLKYLSRVSSQLQINIKNFYFKQSEKISLQQNMRIKIFNIIAFY